MGTVTACWVDNCVANIINVIIKEANTLPGAKNVVTLLDKFLPNKASMIKLTNGNKGIRYTNCSTLSFNF